LDLSSPAGCPCFFQSVDHEAMMAPNLDFPDLRRSGADKVGQSKQQLDPPLVAFLDKRQIPLQCNGDMSLAVAARSCWTKI
jgi:hypothetical protein